jgi:hypothetical protein
MAAKTNAARLLDQLGIHYELREYDVDPIWRRKPLQRRSAFRPNKSSKR